MSHEIETIAYNSSNPPWHGLGVSVSNDLSVEEMLEAAGLDWTVSKRALYFPTDNGVVKRAHGQFGLVRDTDLSLLSVVGSNWAEIQNEQAFSFFKQFVEAGDMNLETAGSLKGGRLIWGLANINKSFKLGNGDEMKGYLLICSPHIFGYRFTIQFTPIRVVCNNTLTWSLKDGPAAGTSAFRMTHARRFDEDAKTEAKNILGIATEQFDTFHETVEMLSHRRVTYEEQTTYFREVLNIPEVDETEEEEDKTPRTLKKFETALLEAPGADMDTTKDTAWGLLNAVTYTVDHVLGRERETALASSWFGPNGSMKRRAFNLAVDLAKAA